MKLTSKKILNVISIIIAVAVLMLASGLPAYAAGEGAGSGWQFSLTPYFWLPSIDGKLKFDVPPGAGGSPDVSIGANNVLDMLKFALLLKGEARKGEWSVFTDFMYLDLGSDKASVKTVTGPDGKVEIPVNVNTSVDFKGMVWQLAGGYTVARSQSSNLDLLGGVRYFSAKPSVDWNLAGPLGLFPKSGSHSQRQNLWDGIVGLRGKVGLGKDWFMPYYLDVGAGSSQLTWQGMGGVGYAFKWVDLLLAYRYMYYDQSGDKLIQNFSFKGPVIGVNFRF